MVRIGPIHPNSESFWFVIKQPSNFDQFKIKKPESIDLQEGNTQCFSCKKWWKIIDRFHLIEPSLKQVRKVETIFDNIIPKSKQF